MTLNRIVFIKDSTIKQEPIQANQLPSTDRQDIPGGTTLVLDSYSIPPGSNDHYKIDLQNIQLKGFSSWFAFSEHVQIIQEAIVPATTVDALIDKQNQKDIANITVNSATLGTQQGFLKLVFNVDTFIKRRPVDSSVLNDESKQLIPAGTELVLATSLPDANNIVKFAVEDNHVKFSLDGLEIKGFSQDWYVFVKHAGIQRVG